MLNSRNEAGAKEAEVCINHSADLVSIGEPQSPASYVIGDLSFMDGKGFLRITRRKKNVLSTSLRRNISPECPESEPLPPSE
jgi:long-chain acyl-CoA synthetase